MLWAAASAEQSHEEPVSVEPCACAKAPSADGLDGSVRIQLATHHSGDEVLLEQDRPSKGARHSSISAFSMASYKLPSEADYSFKATWKAELKMLMVLAVPCILANTSTQTMVVTDQIFVGHLGVSEFAAGALGNTVSCVPACISACMLTCACPKILDKVQPADSTAPAF